MGCLGCDARDKEIDFLRRQVESLQDRLLAVSNPAGYQVYRGVPVHEMPQQQVAGDPVITDAQGEPYVMVGGQRVPLAEYERQMQRLDEFMSGRTPVDSRREAVEEQILKPRAVEEAAGVPL